MKRKKIILGTAFLLLCTFLFTINTYALTKSVVWKKDQWVEYSRMGLKVNSGTDYYYRDVDVNAVVTETQTEKSSETFIFGGYREHTITYYVWE